MGDTPVADGAGKCLIQQNADLCTDQLLDTVGGKCDCYAFCGSKFVSCQSAQGGILQSDECNGIPITGCNRAVVSTVLAVLVFIYYFFTRRSTQQDTKINAELDG